MFLLAQLQDASPNAIKDWLIILGGVMGIALLAKQLFTRNPSIEAEFATKKEISDMEEKIDSNNIAQVREQGVLHEKINAVAVDTAFIRGNLEGRSAERAELVDALREAMKK